MQTYAIEQKEMKNMVNYVLQKIIGNREFEEDKVDKWRTEIRNKCSSELEKHTQDYIIICTIEKKSGRNFYRVGAHRPYSVTVQWENKHMYCFVSMYAKFSDVLHAH